MSGFETQGGSWRPPQHRLLRKICAIVALTCAVFWLIEMLRGASPVDRRHVGAVVYFGIIAAGFVVRSHGWNVARIGWLAFLGVSLPGMSHYRVPPGEMPWEVASMASLLALVTISRIIDRPGTQRDPSTAAEITSKWW